MDYYSIWPFFVCLILLLGLVATPLFVAADTPPSPRPNRLATLDGLRGFLALAVMFHHGSIYHRFLLDGTWALPPSRFYTMLGQTGVGMFFMVTGHLFWSRLLDEAGRPNWTRLYIGRVFRVAPLYLAAVTTVFVIVFIGTGPHLHVSWQQLTRQILAWLSLGYLAGPDVNGYANTQTLLAGVTWTLHYEWLFYLGLPVIALATRRRRTHLPFVVTALTVALALAAMNLAASTFPISPMFAALFLSGMTSASLRHTGVLGRLPDTVASVAVLILLALIFRLFSTAYTAGAVVLSAVVFSLIASGCTLFGLLVSRAARRLGDISYGIYLLQGLALAAVLHNEPLRGMALAAPVLHWLLLLTSAAVLITVATLTHVAIERPGIALGRRIAARLAPVPAPTLVSGRAQSRA